MSEEIKNLHELITNVRLDIRELNTKMDGIKDLSKKVDEVQDTANRAFESTKSAHHRLDELKANDIKEVQDNQKWLWRTALGGLILGAIGLLWKGIGS